MLLCSGLLLTHNVGLGARGASSPRLHLGWRERTQDLGACTGSVQSCRCTPGAHAPRGSAAPAPRAANARLSRAPATAVGLRSQPTARKPRSAAAYNTVPEPQHGSSSAGGRAAGPLPQLPCGAARAAAPLCNAAGAAPPPCGAAGAAASGVVVSACGAVARARRAAWWCEAARETARRASVSSVAAEKE